MNLCTRTILLFPLTLIFPIHLIGQRGVESIGVASRVQLTQDVNAWHFSSASSEQAWLRVEGRSLRTASSRELALPAGFLETRMSSAENFLCVKSLLKIADGERILRLKILSTPDLEPQAIVERKQAFDASIPSVIVSEQGGRIILAENASGRISFYDDRGKMEKSIELFPGADYDLERTLQMDVSADGTELVVLASRRGASPRESEAMEPAGEPHIFLFSATGNELWRRPLALDSGYELSVSPGGKVIAAGSYTMTIDGSMTRRTSFFNARGELLSETDFLFDHCRFSDSVDTLILSNKRSVVSVAVASGQTLWRHEVEAREDIIAGLALSPSGGRVVLLVARNTYSDGGFIFSSPRLEMLSNTGSLVERIDFAGQQFFQPGLHVANGEIWLGFKNEFIKLAVK